MESRSRRSPDGALSWPPARNERCWCGSGAKYKKYRGRPSLS
ncbi:SEC-C metal-binding domain-containing protein [Amycolatopsis sp. WGS_07]